MLYEYVSSLFKNDIKSFYELCNQYYTNFEIDDSQKIEKEFEVSMYLATGEWKLVDEKSEKTPFVKASEAQEK